MYLGYLSALFSIGCCEFYCHCAGAVDYLERHVSEMTCYVLSGMLNPTHSITRIFKCGIVLISMITILCIVN